MLEFALTQERIKFHRLKFGCDPPTIDLNRTSDEGMTNDVAPGKDMFKKFLTHFIFNHDIIFEFKDSEKPFSTATNTSWKQSRTLLHNYLKEIGYNETIIDVRSNRVRSLLCFGNTQEQEENINPNVVNGNNESNKRASESQGIYKNLI